MVNDRINLIIFLYIVWNKDYGNHIINIIFILLLVKTHFVKVYFHKSATGSLNSIFN